MRAFFVFCLLAAAPLHAAQPDAAAMIRGIRLSATLQQIDLNGAIRKDGRPPTPVQFFVREQNMQFRLGSGERQAKEGGRHLLMLLVGFVGHPGHGRGSHVP